MVISKKCSGSNTAGLATFLDKIVNWLQVDWIIFTLARHGSTWHNMAWHSIVALLLPHLTRAALARVGRQGLLIPVDSSVAGHVTENHIYVVLATVNVSFWHH